jgi:hypothetical protein
MMLDNFEVAHTPALAIVVSKMEQKVALEISLEAVPVVRLQPQRHMTTITVNGGGKS